MTVSRFFTAVEARRSQLQFECRIHLQLRCGMQSSTCGVNSKGPSRLDTGPM